MSLTPGQAVTAANDNNAFVSKISDSTVTSKIDLNNADVASGSRVTNVQGYTNELADTVGQTGGYLDANRKNYSSNEIVADGDNRKVAIEKLDAEFNSTTGHAHSGSAGDGAPISAGALVNFNKFFAQWIGFSKTGVTGTSSDVSTQLSLKTPGGGDTFAGVITTPPSNKVILLDNTTGEGFEDASGRKVFGRITESSGVWTLSYFVNISGTETAYSFSSSTDIQFHLLEVYDQANRPTIPSTPEFGSLNLTADVVDASATARGVVSIGTQTFAGNKTFTGTIGASNLSGTNTGDVTLASVGSSPNGSAASLSGQALTLQPADGTNPGVMTAGAQSIGGAKTFTDTTQSTDKDTGAMILEGGLGVEKNINAGGTVSGSNLSGANTGDVTLASFGSTPNANGASLSGQALTLQPADASNPGGLSTTTQSIAGRKNFVGPVQMQDALYGDAEGSAISGASAVLATPSNSVVRLTNGSLTSIGTITPPSSEYQIFTLMNVTGNSVNLLNTNTGSDSILTGTGSDFTLQNNACVLLVYDASASRWRMLGGGGGGSASIDYDIPINYISNFHLEEVVTGWVAFADLAGTTPVDGISGTPNSTITRSTSSPLRGSASLLFTKNSGASRQGEGFSYDFSISDADRGKVIQGSFDYAIASGTYTDDAVRVWIYDTTNNALIACTPYLLKNHSLAAEKFGFEFQTASNSTTYRLIFHVAATDTNAYTLKFDHIVVGPQAKLYGSPVTDWVSFTPTGSWTTNTTYTGRWRRVGDDLEAQYYVTLAGAPTAAALTLNLPSGLSMDTNKMADLGNQRSDWGKARATNGGSTWHAIHPIYNSATSVLLRHDVSAGGTFDDSSVANNSPYTFASGGSVFLQLKVPILGWSSSAIMSNDANTRIIYAAANRTANQTGINPNNSTVKLLFNNVSKDTHGTYDTTNSRYVVSVSGDYDLFAFVDIDSSNVLNSRYFLRYSKNGVDQGYIDIMVPAAGTFFALKASHTIKDLKAGDYIELFLGGVGNNSVSTLIMTPSSFFHIGKKTGPAQIATSEKVYIEYGNSAGTSITGADAVNIIPFATKFRDTHGAWSTNVFTAPRSDFYSVKVHLNIVSMANGTRVIVFLQKNGSNFRRLCALRNSSGVALTLPNQSLTTSTYLLAGETFRINAIMDDATTRSLEASTDVNWIVIESHGGSQ
jgi:hypothetical protein